MAAFILLTTIVILLSQTSLEPLPILYQNLSHAVMRLRKVKQQCHRPPVLDLDGGLSFWDTYIFYMIDMAFLTFTFNDYSSVASSTVVFLKLQQNLVVPEYHFSIPVTSCRSEMMRFYVTNGGVIRISYLFLGVFLISSRTGI